MSTTTVDKLGYQKAAVNSEDRTARIHARASHIGAAEPSKPGQRGIAWPPAKTMYALRACIALAAAAPGTRMKTREIAQAAAAPRSFLSKILGELRDADIVSAQRGYHGGYRLTRAPDDIRLDELLRAVGTCDPFASFSSEAEAPLSFIDDLRSRLHALAAETLRRASLAELAPKI
jgi:Rrf2 family protein